MSFHGSPVWLCTCSTKVFTQTRIKSLKGRTKTNISAICMPDLPVACSAVNSESALKTVGKLVLQESRQSPAQKNPSRSTRSDPMWLVPRKCVVFSLYTTLRACHPSRWRDPGESDLSYRSPRAMKAHASASANSSTHSGGFLLKVPCEDPSV